MEPQASASSPSPPSRRKKPVAGIPVYTDEDLAMFKEAYEEGKRSLDDQVAELDSMRQRSSQFLAFVGSATAFLVGAGLTATAHTPRTLAFYSLAVVASIVSCVSIFALVEILLAIAWPRRKSKKVALSWKVRTSPLKLVRDWIDPQIGGLEPAKFYRELALVYQRNMDANEKSLRRVRATYTVFLITGGVQVLLWGALVWIFA